MTAKFGLPSQMSCNVPRQVAATYKGLRTKVKKNAEHLKLGQTKKRYKGLEKPPKYVSRTCTLNYKRDYSFVKQGVSIITLQAEYENYVNLIKSCQDKVNFGEAKIYYAPSTKTYYLLVSRELEVPDLEPNAIKQIVGVDVGQRYHAVTTNTTNKTHLFGNVPNLAGLGKEHQLNNEKPIKNKLNGRWQNCTHSLTIKLDGSNLANIIISDLMFGS